MRETRKTPKLAKDPLKKVRIRTVGKLGEYWPPAARVLLTYYEALRKDTNLPHTAFAVDALPMSLNHQYIKGKTWSGKTNFRLHPEQEVFRQLVGYAMGPKKLEWLPTGPFAAVILFEMPHWIKQDYTVKEHDADNLVKPLLDAVQRCTGVRDELAWNLHAFKITSKRTRTSVYLYDLGDVVDYFT